MSAFVVSVVAADGLALLDDMTSADTVMIGSHKNGPGI